jgi:hypothetical protein
MAFSNAQDLIASVERVTGGRATKRKETTIVRIEVTSSDGKRCGINVQMGSRTFFQKASLRQVANHLRVPFEEIEHVLENWTPERLRRHLEQFPAEILDSPASLRRFETFRPSS